MCMFKYNFVHLLAPALFNSSAFVFTFLCLPYFCKDNISSESECASLVSFQFLKRLLPKFTQFVLVRPIVKLSFSFHQKEKGGEEWTGTNFSSVGPGQQFDVILKPSPKQQNQCLAVKQFTTTTQSGTREIKQVSKNCKAEAIIKKLCQLMSTKMEVNQLTCLQFTWMTTQPDGVFGPRTKVKCTTKNLSAYFPL